MITFSITATGTTSAKTFDQNVGGTRRATFCAHSAAWESGSITVKATSPGSSTAIAIAGCSAVTADTEKIPVDIPRGASLVVVTTGKSGTTPIIVEID